MGCVKGPECEITLTNEDRTISQWQLYQIHFSYFRFAQLNLADNQYYQHSFLLCVVHYRQSCGYYLAKNSADIEIANNEILSQSCPPSPRF